MAQRRNPRTKGARNIRADRVLEILDRYAEGQDYRDIGREMRIKRGTVWRVLDRVGVLQRQRPYEPRPFVPRALVDENEGDQIFDLYDTTPMSFQEVADMLGRPKSTVGNYHRRNRRRRGLRGRATKAFSNPSRALFPGAMPRSRGPIDAPDAQRSWALPMRSDPDAFGPFAGDTAIYRGRRRYPISDTRFIVSPSKAYRRKWAEVAAAEEAGQKARAKKLREEAQGFPRNFEVHEYLGQLKGGNVLQRSGTLTMPKLIDAFEASADPNDPPVTEETVLTDPGFQALIEGGDLIPAGKAFLRPGDEVTLSRRDPAALHHSRIKAPGGGPMTYYLVDVTGDDDRKYPVWVEATLLEHPDIVASGAMPAPDSVMEALFERAMEEPDEDVEYEGPAPMSALPPSVIAPPPPITLADDAEPDSFDVLAGSVEAEIEDPAVKQLAKVAAKSKAKAKRAKAKKGSTSKKRKGRKKPPPRAEQLAELMEPVAPEAAAEVEVESGDPAVTALASAVSAASAVEDDERARIQRIESLILGDEADEDEALEAMASMSPAEMLAHLSGNAIPEDEDLDEDESIEAPDEPSIIEDEGVAELKEVIARANRAKIDDLIVDEPDGEAPVIDESLVEEMVTAPMPGGFASAVEVDDSDVPEIYQIRDGAEGTIDVLLMPPGERTDEELVESAMAQAGVLHGLANEALFENRDEDAANYYLGAFGNITGVLYALRVMYARGDEDYVESLITPLTQLLQDNAVLAVQMSNRDIIPIRGFFQPTLM